MSMHCVIELFIRFYLGFTVVVIAVEGDSSSRFTLDMTKHLVGTAMAKDLKNIEQSVDSSQTVFFSLDECIYRLITSQENETSVQIIRNDVEIKSFRQISTRRFLVGDKDSVKVYQLSNSLNDSTIEETLVCRKSGCCSQEPNSRCRRNKSFVLGPTAVDRRSSPEAAYYVDDSTIYLINLSTNESATNFKFNGMGERITAMSFNENYSIAFIFCSNTMNVYQFNFQSKTTTPIPFQGNQTRLSIEQTIPISEDLFLCRTLEKSLLLLNINTGSHSYVHGGTTYFSSITNNRSQELLKVNQIADIPTKGSYLLAVGTNWELIHFQYAVNSPNDASSVTPVTGSDEVTSLNRSEKTASVDSLAVFGYAAAVVVLAVGVSIAFVSLRYKKKKRRLIRKYAHRHRRQRRPPDSERVIEDIQLRTFKQGDVQQGEDQLKAESVNKTNSTTSNKENQVRDRPISPIRPILPNRHRQPPVHEGSNNSSVEPYYVKVLENYDRPLNTQTLVQTPQYVQPRLSLLPDERNMGHEQNSNIHLTTCRRKDVEQQRKDYLNDESVAKTKEISWSKENLGEGKPSPSLPDQHRQPPINKHSNDSSDEPYYVEVLDHVDRSTNTRALATKPPYVRPRLSLPPRESSSEILAPKQHSCKFFPPHSPGMREAGPSSEKSHYNDIVCVFPEHSEDFHHYSYAHKPPKASYTKGKQEVHDQDTSNPQPEIVLTITSEKTEIKVWPKQKKEALN